MLRLRIGLAVTVLTAGGAAPAAAQGLALSVAGGISRSLAELVPSPPDVGVAFEVHPHWAFRSGLALGLGFRYTTYSGAPARYSAFADVRYTGTRGAARPVLGLRGGGFAGGDEGGDDPYLGLEIGPIAGVEVPVGERVSLQVLGSTYWVLALYRSARVMPGIQAGLLIR